MRAYPSLDDGRHRRAAPGPRDDLQVGPGGDAVRRRQGRDPGRSRARQDATPCSPPTRACCDRLRRALQQRLRPGHRGARTWRSSRRPAPNISDAPGRRRAGHGGPGRARRLRRRSRPRPRGLGLALEGLRVAVQGVGAVGCALARRLRAAGARLLAGRRRRRRACGALAAELGAAVACRRREIYEAEADVFSPNAAGGILNDRHGPAPALPRGGGRRQRAAPGSRHGDALHARGILYAPDYVVNAGGLLSLLFETGAVRRGGRDGARARDRPAPGVALGAGGRDGTCRRTAWPTSRWRSGSPPREEEHDEAAGPGRRASRTTCRATGPPVLLLHAFPLDRRMWDEQAAALRASHQVIRFDARGFGGSPPRRRPADMERIADDAAALLDHLGVGQAVVCGLSMGGYAAFALVRRHADRGCAAWCSRTRKAPARHAGGARDPRGARGEGAAGGRCGRGRGVPAEAAGRDHATRAPAVVGARPRADRRPTRRAASRTRSPASPRAPTRRRPLREIRVPTLVVCGEEDALTPPSDAEAMHKGIAGSRLDPAPRPGTSRTWRRPDAFGRALARIPGGASSRRRGSAPPRGARAGRAARQGAGRGRR